MRPSARQALVLLTKSEARSGTEQTSPSKSQLYLGASISNQAMPPCSLVNLCSCCPPVYIDLYLCCNKWLP